MRRVTMGKVTVEATIENLDDLFRADRGELSQDQVRGVTVTDALVDTGATMLSMPRRLIDQIGLTRYKTRQAKTAVGLFEFGVYRAARLTVQGRDCIIDVTEVADDCPVLIGQIPLEGLDFLVDPVGQRLVGNPDHNGEHMFDLF